MRYRTIGWQMCLFVFFLAILTFDALAHDWYDGWCCNDSDCAPYAGEVQETPQGYFIPQFNVTVPYSKPQGRVESRHPAEREGARYDMPGDDPSPYHLCEFPIGSGTVRCFYARQGGV